jgi:hypothetical protein
MQPDSGALRGKSYQRTTPRYLLRVVVAVAAIAIFAWLVAGEHGRSSMNETEVQERAEEIAHMVLAVADGVPRRDEDWIESESRKVVLEYPDPWRYWQVRVDIGLTDDSPTSPREVEANMIQMLTADGWVRDVPAGAESNSIGRTLRKNERGGTWTVVIGSSNFPPPVAQAVHFWVVSPTVDH